MTEQPVTTNPLLIMVINMTIVFGVLLLLGYVIRFLYWVDPTRRKKEQMELRLAQEHDPEVVQIAGCSIEEKELAAVLTTAIMAYGYQDVRVKSIRKV